MLPLALLLFCAPRGSAHPPGPSPRPTPARATTPHPPLGIRLDPDLQARTRAITRTPVGCAALVLDLRSRQLVAVQDATTTLEGRFPPGSLLKLVTAVALLDGGEATGHETVTCRDRASFWGRTFTCGLPGGHGPLDLAGALERSCSIWFYSVGQRLDRDALHRAARALGLGDADAPATTARRGSLEPGPSRRDFTLALAGEGSGVRLAPWQVAVMLERIASPRPFGPSPSLHACRVIRAALRNAVLRGTATGAARPGVAVAGKTGTAAMDGPARDVPNPEATNTHGWFAGYAPADDPRFVAVVFLRRGTGRAASVVGGRLLEAATEGGRP